MERSRKDALEQMRMDEKLVELLGDDGLKMVQEKASDAFSSEALGGDTALRNGGSRDVALRLLAAGADTVILSAEGRRLVFGFPAESADEYQLVSRDDYLHGCCRRFGRANPEETNEPFWEAMVRSGVSAWAGAQAFYNATQDAE